MKNLFIIIFLFLILILKAEALPVTWMRYYDYNNWSNAGHQVIQTYDGGFAFYSETSVTDNYLKKNILFTKTDLFGVVEFQILFTDSTSTGLFPTAFQQTKDSGFILAGIANITGFLIKIDKFGNILWHRDYTRPGFTIRFWTMKITQDNGYICGGDIYSSSLRQYILKADSIGNIQWDSVYIGFSVSDIVQSTTGFYYVVNGNIFRKLNSTGGIVWEIDSNVSARQILEHSNGYFYTLFGLNLSKYDSSGNFYWKKNYYKSFPATVYFRDFCLSRNTDLILSGIISDPYTIYPDCFLARLDTDGMVKNQKIIQIGKQDYDYLESIFPTTDNGFICTGYTSFAGSRLLWNTIGLKTDSDFNTTPIVSINYTNSSIINEFELFQNYPNPFNPVTTIKYSIPISGLVTLKIYDVLGKELRILVNETKSAGTYKIEFDGNSLPSGIYFYRIQSADFVDTKRMILLK